MQEIIITFGIDLRLLIIQGINFGILLFLLWRFLYKPVLRMLDERQKVIAEGVENAKQVEKEREGIESERAEVLKKATAEGESLMLSARERAKEDELSMTKAAEAKSNQILKDAELRAEELTREAQAENKKEAARLAVLAAEKILRNQNAG